MYNITPYPQPNNEYKLENEHFPFSLNKLTHVFPTLQKKNMQSAN